MRHEKRGHLAIANMQRVLRERDRIAWQPVGTQVALRELKLSHPTVPPESGKSMPSFNMSA